MNDKIQVVIVGETWTHELTFRYFKKNVVEQLKADFALCVGDSVRETPNPFYSLAKYVWKFNQTEERAAAFGELAPKADWRTMVEVNDYWFGVIAHPDKARINIFFPSCCAGRSPKPASSATKSWCCMRCSTASWRCRGRRSRMPSRWRRA